MDLIKVIKLQIENKKWQILNEDRSDKDSLQEELASLERELELEENRIKRNEKWDKWFNNLNPKVSESEWNDDDYDHLRESEEASEIVFNNL
ncbi:MAG: hypothetical protein U0354_20970 [Candidatus Sericytochromatia bacterium]